MSIYKIKFLWQEKLGMVFTTQDRIEPIKFESMFWDRNALYWLHAHLFSLSLSLACFDFPLQSIKVNILFYLYEVI